MQVVQGWLFGCDSRVRHPRYSANAWAGRTSGYGRSQGPMPPAHRQRVSGAFTRACVWRAQGSAHRTVGIFLAPAHVPPLCSPTGVKAPTPRASGLIQPRPYHRRCSCRAQSLLVVRSLDWVSKAAQRRSPCLPGKGQSRNKRWGALKNGSLLRRSHQRPNDHTILL